MKKRIILRRAALILLLIILSSIKTLAIDKYEYVENGEKFLEEGNYASAEEEFQKAIALAPQDYYLILQIAKAYYDRAIYDKATNYILKAIESDPKNAKVYEYLTKIAFDMSESFPEVAIEALKQAIQKCPIPEVSASLYKRMGTVYFVQGKYNEAIEAYKTILEKYKDLEKECAKVQNAIALLYYETGQFEEAINNFNITLDKYKSMPNYCVEALIYLGCIYFEKGDSKKAIELWEKGAELNKKSPEPKKSIEYLTNKITLNEFLKIIQSMPWVWADDAYFLIGISYEVKGEFNKAKEYYEKSLHNRQITKDFPYYPIKRRLEKITK